MFLLSSVPRLSRGIPNPLSVMQVKYGTEKIKCLEGRKALTDKVPTPQPFREDPSEYLRWSNSLKLTLVEILQEACPPVLVR